MVRLNSINQIFCRLRNKYTWITYIGLFQTLQWPFEKNNEKSYISLLPLNQFLSFSVAMMHDMSDCKEFLFLFENDFFKIEKKDRLKVIKRKGNIRYLVPINDAKSFDLCNCENNVVLFFLKLHFIWYKFVFIFSGLCQKMI